MVLHFVLLDLVAGSPVTRFVSTRAEVHTVVALGEPKVLSYADVPQRWLHTSEGKEVLARRHALRVVSKLTLGLVDLVDRCLVGVRPEQRAQGEGTSRS